MKKELELYIHIPFCLRKCLYCDFLSAPASEEKRQAYVDALTARIRNYGRTYRDCQVTSIFLGGGTPSILTAEQTRAIMKAITDAFAIEKDAEITTEMNPKTADRKKLEAYRALGINRLSIGLQSADDAELRSLGRVHTYEDFLETYQWARDAGFSNINVDLMTAIPGQTTESYRKTLEKITALGPEHISAYSLILEEGTPFYAMYVEGTEGKNDLPVLPDEDTEREMYVMTRDILAAEGYHRYEISNYAREGYECRHNLGYWERKEYLGIGNGAASLIGHTRFREPEDITVEESLDSRVQVQELSVKDEMEEFMFLGLRRTAGISASAFREAFGVRLEDVYGTVIKKHTSQNLLVWDGDNLRLTERGLDVCNYVMSDFLLS